MITLHKHHLVALLTLLLSLVGISIVQAWTGPTAAPPGSNVDAPVNVGSGNQVKEGGLSVDAFTVFGLTYLQPVSGGVSSGVTIDTQYLPNSSNGMLFSAPTGWTGNFIRATLNNVDQFAVAQDGNVTANGYFHYSDARLKDNIQTIPGLDIIAKLRGVTFERKESGVAGAGVIAQEVEAVLPEAVHTDADGMKSVNYDALVAPLIEAIKEQQAEIDALKKEVETLKRNAQ